VSQAVSPGGREGRVSPIGEGRKKKSALPEGGGGRAKAALWRAGKEKEKRKKRTKKKCPKRLKKGIILSRGKKKKGMAVAFTTRPLRNPFDDP